MGEGGREGGEGGEVAEGYWQEKLNDQSHKAFGGHTASLFL